MKAFLKNILLLADLTGLEQKLRAKSNLIAYAPIQKCHFENLSGLNPKKQPSTNSVHIHLNKTSNPLQINILLVSLLEITYILKPAHHLCPFQVTVPGTRYQRPVG